MPDECVDMVLTSPPYWGLRDYGIQQIFGGNKDCKHEWGDEIKRINSGGRGYKQDTNKGSFFINKQCICQKCGAWRGQLGLEPTPEMYIKHLTNIFNEVKRVLKKEGTLWLNIGDTYGGSGGDHKEWHKNDAGFQGGLMRGCQLKKLMPKCLLMIPERLAWSLIQDGWILRNKIIWHKPNAMPSSVKDRFSNKWEYLFLFSKNKKYYFDLDLIREPYIKPLNRWGGDKLIAKGKSTWDEATGQTTYRNRDMRPNALGKNPGDIWMINTQPFPKAHFAVFPEKLCEKPIKAGCPEGGIVLDPFCGSGTALFVAQQLKRWYIGIEMNPEYCKIAEKRLAQGVL
ncbi:MAG: DNA-methyltransferase [Candidatus Hodarchaeales archaeon]